MTSVCRLCLSDSEALEDLLEEHDGLPLSVIAMIICPVKISISSENEFLPKQICYDCKETIVRAYKLRNVSIDTERILKSYNEEDQFMKLEDSQVAVVEKIAAESSNLQSETEEENALGSEQEEYVEEEEHTTKRISIRNGDSTSKVSYVVYEEEDFEEVTENFKYRVDCQSIQTRKSPVWNYIGYLTDEKGNHIESEKGYYYCRLCVEEKHTLRPKYRIESIATSVLFSHLHKNHGINKAEMSENSSFSITHVPPELASCEVCSKSFNAASLHIHVGIEHGTEETLRRVEENKSQYKVNCYKNSSKSLAWDYFGILENLEGETQDEYYFYCRLCVEEENKLSPKYTKNTSTSILLGHLKSAHIPKSPEELAKRKLPEPIVYNSSKRSKSDEFSCEICGDYHDSKKSLNRHLADKHNQLTPKNYVCDYEDCSLAFTMRDTLLKHIKYKHKGIKYPCPQCPNVLSTPTSLRRHIDCCHLKLRSFTCDTCNATFTEQKSLKNHIQKAHLGTPLGKNVPCEICDMKFINLWSMKRHLLTHTGEVRRL